LLSGNTTGHIFDAHNLAGRGAPDVLVGFANWEDLLLVLKRSVHALGDAQEIDLTPATLAKPTGAVDQKLAGSAGPIGGGRDQLRPVPV
jgi:hypothetical protein